MKKRRDSNCNLHSSVPRKNRLIMFSTRFCKGDSIQTQIACSYLYLTPSNTHLFYDHKQPFILSAHEATLSSTMRCKS